MSTNPPPINGISRKPCDVFGGAPPINGISRKPCDVFGGAPPINGISRKPCDVFGGGFAANAIRRSQGFVPTSLSVDITSDNAAAILAAVQSVDASASTVLQVQQNASSAADSQSWSDS